MADLATQYRQWASQLRDLATDGRRPDVQRLRILARQFDVTADGLDTGTDGAAVNRASSIQRAVWSVPS